ncbi:MAG: hypothetical protein WAN11_08640 [Syntrophobacteraceae bacterium]
MPVGFFTSGVECALPHQQIDQRIVLLICKVIKKAWQLLKEKPPSDFHTQSADEDKITQILVEIIENRLRKSGDVEGFNCALFGKVIREPKITNFDKAHPDKMPDILFDLRRDKLPIVSDQDGLFVECKPIDPQHPILSHYCNKGLVRFVNGDYAWAMQDALMVGYVKGRYSFIKLESILDDDKSKATLKPIEHSAVDKSQKGFSLAGKPWPSLPDNSIPSLAVHMIFSISWC